MAMAMIVTTMMHVEGTEVRKPIRIERTEKELMMKILKLCMLCCFRRKKIVKHGDGALGDDKKDERRGRRRRGAGERRGRRYSQAELSVELSFKMSEPPEKRSLFALLEQDALKVVAERAREQERLARKKAREKRRTPFKSKDAAPAPVGPVKQAEDETGGVVEGEKEGQLGNQSEQQQQQHETSEDETHVDVEDTQDTGDTEDTQDTGDTEDTRTEPKEDEKGEQEMSQGTRDVSFTANKQSLLWRSKHLPAKFSADDSNFHFHPPQPLRVQEKSYCKSFPVRLPALIACR
eukprot:749768-Hanusia_phi.AAC.3